MHNFESVVESLPSHLRQYVVDQNYDRYTPENQATWRFVMRQLKSYLSQKAHACYEEGLEKTGITVDRIPKVSKMSEKLQEFGWSAVPVSGFIPPAAFMELQSLGILPIASDMRAIDHILYTPAPDIVHEAAGHAPILVDPEFASYLKKYAQVAKKALISSEDLKLYEAIRELSDIKESPDSTDQDIQGAEQKLQDIVASMSHVSEAALLGRMNWWTAEYGLIGPTTDPLIFGAGLLSSVGEARSCLKEDVKKIPLSMECIETTYDITEKQPQLFVAKDFSQLHDVLEELANKMAFRHGGAEGLEKSLKAKTVNTIQLNSGLQISGQLEVYKKHGGEVSFFKTTGPTQISFRENEIPGHDKNYHSHGYSSPLGELKQGALSRMTPEELFELGLEEGTKARLEFQSGIVVSGQVDTLLMHNERLLMISWSQCTTTLDDEVLFAPDWGIFDMAVGESVSSVFSGPADRLAFGQTQTFKAEVIPLRQHSSEEKVAFELYEQIAKLRDHLKGGSHPTALQTLCHRVMTHPQKTWLMEMELLEMVSIHEKDNNELMEQLEKNLSSNTYPQDYVRLGLELVGQQL